ncbi:hypothetical protein CXG81DRAFT_20088 [Caulochytrium protostelioides]|uniref:G-protein coupled receptors family 3 profile domain-containing protein n=1 Tax=Caulochytrium protostelioides TaxID=1555241 RepID=A0A4P9X482_9FUNG|nr:hypothetical protein CXG81DRAFT_20088 [Caulochytrium protostelioides]|eukprot:RKO99876.1 hypothetical protein CXG81DRAFT_20088 [Caulochytrium protostelioides]
MERLAVHGPPLRRMGPPVAPLWRRMTRGASTGPTAMMLIMAMLLLTALSTAAQTVSEPSSSSSSGSSVETTDASSSSSSAFAVTVPPTILHLGVVLPDAYGAVIPSIRQTVQYAIDDINRDATTRLPANTRLEPMFLDSHSASDVAVQHILDNTRRTDPIVGIIGEFTSAVAEPMALVAKALHLPMCSSATTKALSNKKIYSTFFRTLPSDATQSRVVASFVHSLGWRHVALLTSNDDYGLQIATDFQQDGRVNVLATVAYMPGTTDFASHARAIKDAKARVVLCFGYAHDIALFLREAREQDMMNREWAYIGTDAVAPLPSMIHASPEIYSDLDHDNIRGMLFIKHDEQGDNAIYRDVLARYAKDHGGARPEQYGMLYYDCVQAMLNGLHRTVEAAHGNLDTILRPQRFELAHFLHPFEGASGPVAFTEDGNREAKFIVNNVRPDGSVVRVRAMGIEAHETTEYAPITFRDGSANPPADRPHVEILSRGHSGAAPIVIMVFATLALCINIITVAYLWMHRRNPVVMQMSFPHIMLIATGVQLGFLGSLSWMHVPSQFICSWQQWVPWLAYGIIMSNLMVKVWRIYHIFDNIRILSTKITDQYLFFGSALVMLPYLIILTVWQYNDPWRPRYVESNAYIYLACATTERSKELMFEGCLAGYSGLHLLAVAFLAYKTRHVNANFRESYWIAHASTNTILCSAIAIMIIIVTHADPLEKLYVRAIASLFGTFVLYACLVGRIAARLITHSRIDKDRRHLETSHPRLSRWRQGLRVARSLAGADSADDTPFATKPIPCGASCHDHTSAAYGNPDYENAPPPPAGAAAGGGGGGTGANGLLDGDGRDHAAGPDGPGGPGGDPAAGWATMGAADDGQRTASGFGGRRTHGFNSRVYKVIVKDLDKTWSQWVKTQLVICPDEHCVLMYAVERGGVGRGMRQAIGKCIDISDLWIEGANLTDCFTLCTRADHLQPAHFGIRMEPGR